MICLTAISLLTGNLAYSTARAMPDKTPMQTTVSLSQFKPVLDDLRQRFPSYPEFPVIVISASDQKLYFINKNQPVRDFIISTAEAGLGSLSGSNKTPLGVHRVARKFGDNAPAGTIFKARQNTGRIAPILTEPGARSNADNVTTRILWLDGLEPGLNKGGKVDSKARYIYIHGTDEEGRLGAPASHGCIRMKNDDVIDLYRQVPKGTLVTILE